MKTKILQEFLNSTLEIKSQEKLKQYIQFCITNNQQEKIKGKTSYHHILPQANSCFPKYSNLKENPWNGTHLLYSDHYYAHYLFTEAIDNYSQLSAFCAMNNKDIKNGRISENDLIPAEEFQKKMEERSENHSKLLNSKEWRNTKGKIQSEKHKEIKNSEEWKNTIGKEQARKIKETKNSIEWENTTGKKMKDKMSYTKNSEEWKNTIGKEQARKIKETLNSEEWKKEVGINHRKKILSTKLKKGKWFKLYTNSSIKIMPYCDLNELSSSLPKSSFEKPLGNSKSSIATLKRFGNFHKVGWYAELYFPTLKEQEIYLKEKI